MNKAKGIKMEISTVEEFQKYRDECDANGVSACDYCPARNMCDNDKFLILNCDETFELVYCKGDQS